MTRFIVAFIACILAFPAFAADDSKTIHVGMVTWPGNGVAFVARDKGFFGDLNVDIKIIDDMTALANAIRSGEVDVINQATDGAAMQFGNGLDGKAVFTTDVSYGGDGLIAGSAIKSVSDIKGKKVGYTRANASHFLLHKVLQSNGMTFSDIEQVTFEDPGLAAQALFAGKVDVAVTWEPFLSQAEQKGIGHIIASTKDYPESIPNVFLFTSASLKAKPDAAKAFVTGMLKALEYTAQHPDEAAAIMAKGFNLKDQEIKDSLKGMKLLTRADNQAYFCAKDPQFSVAFNEAAQFWADQKLVKQKPKDGAAYISTIGCDLYKPEAKK